MPSSLLDHNRAADPKIAREQGEVLFKPYNNALESFGSPIGGELSARNNMQTSDGRLPSTFVQFRDAYGTGKWQKGYFQFCEPSDYQSILQFVLNNDPDLRASRSHVVGLWAFKNCLSGTKTIGW